MISVVDPAGDFNWSEFAAAMARLDDGDYLPGDGGERMRFVDLAVINRAEPMLRRHHAAYVDTLGLFADRVAS